MATSSRCAGNLRSYSTWKGRACYITCSATLSRTRTSRSNCTCSHHGCTRSDMLLSYGSRKRWWRRGSSHSLRKAGSRRWHITNGRNSGACYSHYTGTPRHGPWLGRSCSPWLRSSCSCDRRSSCYRYSRGTTCRRRAACYSTSASCSFG